MSVLPVMTRRSPIKWVQWVVAAIALSVAVTVSLRASADPAIVSEDGIVRLHETEVFTFHAPRTGHSAIERAHLATQALERIVDEHTEGEPHFEERDGTAVVLVAGIPVAQLGEGDALAAGDASLEVHASSVMARIRTALQVERTRRSIADTVFSCSLLVLSGVVAFLMLSRVGDVVTRFHDWALAHPSRVPSVRIGKIEVVRPTAVRGAMTVSLSVTKVLAQIGIVYAWILIGLSLFESTRGYSTRLTGYVLSPVYALIGRLGSAVPVLFVNVIALTGVLIFLRFVTLFFGSIARRETSVAWLPPDLAAPTGLLVRFAIVVTALLVGVPLLTGNEDGGFARVGIAALGSVALAATPLLSNIAIGIPIVFQRRFRVGDWVELGGTVGCVRAVGLVETQLDDELGQLIRVPHLLSLLRRTRIFGSAHPSSFTVDIDSRIAPSHVAAIAKQAAGAEGASARVEVVSMQSGQTRFRISFAGRIGQDINALSIAVADVLVREGSSLGMQPAREPT